MWRWNIELQTGIASLDSARRRTIEAIGDFMRDMDGPQTSEDVVRGLIRVTYKAMTAMFAVEGELLKDAGEGGGHAETHDAMAARYAELCRRMAAPAPRDTFTNCASKSSMC